VTSPVIEYKGTHRFGIPPDELWAAIGRTDRFGSWWGWLEEFRVDAGAASQADGAASPADDAASPADGGGLRAGTVLRGVVAPPVPYRMRVQVEILRVSPPVEVVAAVHGDLEGTARLSVHPAGTGSSVDISWKVEMMQRPMRIACRFGYPVIKWGHDRVLEMTVSSFRRHVESEWRAGNSGQPCDGKAGGEQDD
jgi:carbon monoxide dehydrogenase subunit G